MRNSAIVSILLCFGAQLRAQNGQSLAAILERLERLEQQNHELMNEIRALREQISAQQSPQASTPTLEERVEIQERRTEELQETKVQASHRLPLSVSGMVLFNAFLNTRPGGAQDFPTTAALNPIPRTGGATLRQTILGLQFESPNTVFGAKVNGSVFMDFFANPPGGSTERAISANLNRLMRLRTANVELDWGATKFAVGQDKPIFSPREPTTLVQVGVSPLTNAGNPWLWQPQARLEHRFRFDENTNFTATVGVFQTAEAGGGLPEAVLSTLESSRPGYEGRFAFHRTLPNEGHFEVAPGFHLSTTHVLGTSVPSRVYSVDWSMAPIDKLQFTGLFYGGQNTANLGTLRPGFTVRGPGNVIPVRSLGGWAQISYSLTPRLTFNVYGGQHDDRNRDLSPGSIGKNLAYAGNALYRIAPNVIIGFETMQVRTTYLDAGRRLNNHYDLALAYQF